jgi:hypothetical protein
MNDAEQQASSQSEAAWFNAAQSVLASPSSPVACPACNNRAITATWHVTDPATGIAAVRMNCSSCGAARAVRMTLPPGAWPFHPTGDVAALVGSVGAITESLLEDVRRRAAGMPAAEFTTDPLWEEARWSATTFRWHPTGQAPPLMGLVFENGAAARSLFGKFADRRGAANRSGGIRVSIIQGEDSGQVPPYCVHICPDPEALVAHAATGDPALDRHLPLFFGRWNRMYPQPGWPRMLPRFKSEFTRHREFLLAPVTRSPDGQMVV